MPRMFGRLKLFGWVALATLLVPYTLCARTGVKSATLLDRAGTPIPWDTAFLDQSGNRPVHFVARYVDSRSQSHRLEEWRVGQTHLRRRTDSSIDLHADASRPASEGQQPEYVWQILDMQKQIAHRASTAGLLHLGMFYSYYSMAHLLNRPAGRFEVVASSAPEQAGGRNRTSLDRNLSSENDREPAGTCEWRQIDAAGEPITRVCWLPRYGVPQQIWAQVRNAWQLTFVLTTIDEHHIPPQIFKVDLKNFQTRDLDELQSED